MSLFLAFFCIWLRRKLFSYVPLKIDDSPVTLEIYDRFVFRRKLLLAHSLLVLIGV